VSALPETLATRQPRPQLRAVQPDPELRALDESPSWPVTRLVSASLMLALGVAVLAPLIGATGDVAGLLVPALVATLTTRALFEALAFTSSRLTWDSNLVPALVPALLGAGVVAGSAGVLGEGVHVAASGLTALLATLTLIIAGAARNLEIRVRLGLRRVYFVGSPQTRRDLERELGRRRDTRLVGGTSCGGAIDCAQFVETVRAARATVLVLDGAAMHDPALVEAASRLNLAGVRIRELVSYYESEFKKVPLTELTPTWFLFDIAPIHRRAGYCALRRGAELIAASLLLFASLPLLVLAVVAIKLTSPGSALYRQERIGRGGSRFTLLKLRTMSQGSGEAEWAESAAGRITTVGAFLRRFRVDELPQLANVIKGDLALVGPRPEQVPIVERLERELPHYAARHCIRPGLTGWAQVNLGYAGSMEGTVAKLQRDIYYVKHSSIRLDGLILWLTFKTLIAGRG
jgi:lipopolysaccharide/colanic/teichoic acid biosynthesis glycosyltransferase